MKNTKRILLSLALVSGLATVTTAATAHKTAAEHRSQQVERLTDKLALNTEQSAQVAELLATLVNKRSSKTEKKERRQAHQAKFKALMADAEFNEQTIIAEMTLRSAKHQEKIIAKMSVQHQIYQLLGDEQQVKYLDIIEHRMAKKHRRNH